MKQLLTIGYAIFLVIYLLLLFAVTYHERRFMLSGDPALRWMKILQIGIGSLIALSFVSFISILKT
ncbi:MAG: hypothetical protein AAB372_01630 [Patescibacteria group bacterium]